MKQIKMFIETEYKGRPESGEGKYITLLEYTLKNGTPHTKQYEGHLNNTTNNRLTIHSVICGFSHLTTECEVEIYLNNPYVAETIKQQRYYEWAITGWVTRDKPIKNRDLWEQMIEYTDKHMIYTKQVRGSSYSMVLQSQINKMEIDPVEDRLEESHGA